MAWYAHWKWCQNQLWTVAALYFRFSRVDLCARSKLSHGRRHLRLSTFLMRLLIMNCGCKLPYDSLTALLLWIVKHNTVGRLLVAVVSEMWIVSGKSHPLTTMWPRFSLHVLLSSVIKCLERGHKVAKMLFTFKIMDD
jgi:hypothetical protein